MNVNQRPEAYTHKTPRVVAARRLTSRSAREESRRFLVEGAQAVGEALRGQTRMHELFVTASAVRRHDELVQHAAGLGVAVSPVTERAGEMLSETVSPQGIVAVCDTIDVELATLLDRPVHLVVVLVGIGDPGNAGTVLRTADAAGADAIIFAGDAVDVHNGKCVRASAGSLFHIPVVRARDVGAVVGTCRSAGLTLIGADGQAAQGLDDDRLRVRLCQPTAWMFGNEARGLDETVLAALDEVVRVPIYGSAESLNLAGAAAVCLYTSAMVRRTEGRSA